MERGWAKCQVRCDRYDPAHLKELCKRYLFNIMEGTDVTVAEAVDGSRGFPQWSSTQLVANFWFWILQYVTVTFSDSWKLATWHPSQAISDKYQVQGYQRLMKRCDENVKLLENVNLNWKWKLRNENATFISTSFRSEDYRESHSQSIGKACGLALLPGFCWRASLLVWARLSGQSIFAHSWQNQNQSMSNSTMMSSILKLVLRHEVSPEHMFIMTRRSLLAGPMVVACY